jgi:hypothetical protein
MMNPPIPMLSPVITSSRVEIFSETTGAGLEPSTTVRVESAATGQPHPQSRWAR